MLGESLVCTVSVEATDPDDDALDYAYTWLLNGVDAGISDTEVEGSALEEGQEWTCQVVASDGDLEGDPGEASVTVPACENSGSVSIDRSPAGLVVDWRPTLAASYDDITAELWVRFWGSVSEAPYFLMSYEGDNYGPVWLGNISEVEDGDWHHLARVFDSTSGESRVYVDGTLISTEAYSAPTLGDEGLWIGGPTSTGYDSHTCNCELQGVRVSDSVLYGSAFTAPERYGPDSDTLLFLPLTTSTDGSGVDYGPYSLTVTAQSTASAGGDGPFCYDP